MQLQSTLTCPACGFKFAKAEECPDCGLFLGTPTPEAGAGA